MNQGGRLSGERANRIRDAIVERYEKLVEMYKEEYMQSGYAPFTDRLGEYGQYEKLVAERGANDPAFWGDPRAIAKLARLEQKYGPSPALAGPGFSPSGIPARSPAVLGATLTSAKLGEPPMGQAPTPIGNFLGGQAA